MIPLIVPIVAAAPPELAGIGIVEQLGRRVPADLVLVDETGHGAPLSTWLGEEPTVLLLAYYRCPMLCGVAIEEAAHAVGQLADPRASVVVVSFDPEDTPGRAAEARTRAITQGATGSWAFLVGGSDGVQPLLDAVGVTVRRDPATGQFAHPSALIVLSPDGRISRYVEGPRPDPAVLADAIADARDGRTGPPTLGEWVLACFRWTPTHRAFAPRVTAFFRIGGVAILGAVLLGIVAIARRAREVR